MSDSVQRYNNYFKFANNRMSFSKFKGASLHACPHALDYERLSLLERTAYSHRKNGLFDLKERLFRIERTAYSNRKDGLKAGGIRQLQKESVSLPLCLRGVSRFLPCDSVGIRTRDPQLRRLLLYPAELRNQSGYVSKLRAKVSIFLLSTKFFEEKVVIII